jgi:hypothetical protein
VAVRVAVLATVCPLGHPKAVRVAVLAMVCPLGHPSVAVLATVCPFGHPKAGRVGVFATFSPSGHSKAGRGRLKYREPEAGLYYCKSRRTSDHHGILPRKGLGTKNEQ